VCLPPAVAECQETDDTFPTITPHDLRHTAASLAISAGANVLAVSRMLGHKDAAMTLNTYSDLFDTDVDAVAARMDDEIRNAAGSCGIPTEPANTDTLKINGLQSAYGARLGNCARRVPVARLLPPLASRSR